MNSCLAQNNSKLKMWHFVWYSFLRKITTDQWNLAFFLQIKIPKGKESLKQKSQKKTLYVMIKYLLLISTLLRFSSYLYLLNQQFLPGKETLQNQFRWIELQEVRNFQIFRNHHYRMLLQSHIQSLLLQTLPHSFYKQHKIFLV